MGMQWLSGRALESRPKGRGLTPQGRNCVVSLSINLCFVLVQPSKTRPDVTEKIVDWDVKDQINQTKQNDSSYIIFKRQSLCGGDKNSLNLFVTKFMHIIGVAPITQLRTCAIKSNDQGRSPKELLLKERIHSLWEQILSFKRSSHFEKGRNWRDSLLDPVVSL